MDAKQHIRALGLHERAARLGADAREAFLDEQCAGEPDLRAAVDELFASAGQSTDAIDVTRSMSAGEHRAGLSASDDLQIGPYKLLKRIGEGGFGVVYLADQEEPVRRRVALKIIKLGMDTREVVLRFEAERQALALMNHANVARVFDGGATREGRPYFVMEYVAGVPITEYCDRHKLTTGARLELFTSVCEAVQHAHQKGIIHRDLKPSNVLVTLEGEKPVCKVIDFGIAKATNQRLTEQTVFTEHGQLIGTPEYMSPEQAEMNQLDIDTRTDIYSLGVLLYELLTGALPFDAFSLRRGGLIEIQRIIREVEPSKPSARLSALGRAPEPGAAEGLDARESAAEGTGERATKLVRAAERRGTDPHALIRLLRGDLDWITMKALEKDRTRRYASASDLASDLRRHLSHEPVLAGPPSTAYRVRKFVRRNRGAVAAAAGFAVLVAGAGVALGVSYRHQRAARLAANEQRDRAVAAERKSHELLAESYAQSAVLAAQRGNWRLGIQNYERALAEGHPDPSAIRLGIIRCRWALSEHKTAKAEIDALAERKDLGRLTGQVKLWQAEISMNNGKTKKAKRLLKEAIDAGLPPADEAYARAMSADTLPETTRYLAEAIRHDPFHPTAVPMIAVAHYLCGERGLAAERATAAAAVFPDDIFSPCLLMFLKVQEGGREAAAPIIEQIRPRHGEKVTRALDEIAKVIDEEQQRRLLGLESGSDSATEYLRSMKGTLKLVTTVRALWPEGEPSSIQSVWPPSMEAFGDMLPAYTLVMLGQHKQGVARLRRIADAIPMGDLRLMLASALRRANRLDEAADEAYKVVGGRNVIGMPPHLAAALVAQIEIEVAKRDSRPGAYVFKRKEQLCRAIRAYVALGKFGAMGKTIAPWAVAAGEFESADTLIGDALRRNPADEEALLLKAELEQRRGAYGPALEAAVAAWRARPGDDKAIKLVETLRSSTGMVGPPGAAVSADEFVREHRPAGQEPTSPPKTSKRADGESLENNQP